MFAELYYWMYKVVLKNKSNKEPEINAYFLFSLFEIFNICTLWGYINYFLDIFIPRDTVVILAIILIVIQLVINFIFLYKKSSKIINKMEGLTTKRKNIGKLLFVFYILSSLFLMFYVMSNFVPVRY